MYTEMQDSIQTLPTQYLNTPGVLQKSGALVKSHGSRALISGGQRALQSVKKELLPSLERSRIDFSTHTFVGECCEENVDLIVNEIHRMEADVVIGVGGGKALDTAKAAANKTGLPTICIPTIAATCSAASPASVMYDSEGNFIKSLYFPTTPELVLVEPSVVARAPVEYLTSGILDALSKWYELKPIFSRMENPDIHTRSSIELSRLLKDTIEQEGPAAVAAAKNGETNEELIHIIDINIYITGVIKCLSIYTLTIAVAHAINNSLSYIKESHSSLHGMKVGYGIVVQQCLEGESDTNVKSIIDLFKQLGFTPSLESMGVPASQEYKERVADNCIDDEGVKNMPFTITREMMLKSIERVEDIAR